MNKQLTFIYVFVFFIIIYVFVFFIIVLGFIFSDSHTNPQVFKNKFGYYSIQVKTWYNKPLYFDFNQMEERNVFVVPELHNKGYSLFTKNEKLIESALIWINYRQSLEKESQLLARSKNERINQTN